MNWGNQLLVFGIEKLPHFLSMTWYHISGVFWQLLMNIWTLLATLVDAIEGVFRSLAGLGTDGEVHDMASEIIQHPIVTTIFNNLVGVSAALLVFFTIVKILQQQYKEKQGGSPYTIVFRMFKGMMMFFFVTAACLVGLYASGVVFRALDSATGGGTNSISGQVFKSMAHDANLLRIGDPGTETDYETAEQYYYARVSSKYNTYGDGMKYSIAECSGEPINNAEAQAWYDSLSTNHWGVVNSDGTVIPLKAALERGDFTTDKYESNLDSVVGGYQELGGNGNSSFSADAENGSAHGSAGYKNDILSAFDTKIQPAIDINWSPIAIKEMTIAMKQEEKLHDVDTGIFAAGSGSIWSAQYANCWFYIEQPYHTLPITENNMFSINLKGRAALQGGEVSAKFDLNTFVTELPVEKIMATIVVNNALIGLIDKYIYRLLGQGSQAAQQMKLFWSVGPIAVNLLSLFKTVAGPLFDGLINSTLYTLTMGTVDNYNEYLTIGDTDDTPISWKKYELFDDENWEDLWKQIAKTFDDLKEQINTVYTESTLDMEKAKSQVNNLVKEVDRQAAWAKYKAAVIGYNESIMNPLIQLIDYADQFNADDFVTKTAEEREEIEDTIVKKWQELVFLYTQFDAVRSAAKPSAYKASTVVKQVYLPAFTTSYDRNSGYKLKAHEIVEELTKPKKTKLNLVKNPTGAAGVYQIVDWAVYEPTTVTIYNRFADVYENSPSELLFMNANSFTPSNFQLGLEFTNRMLTQGDVFSKATLNTDGSTQTANDAGDFLKVAAINQSMAEELNTVTYRESTADSNGLTAASSNTNATVNSGARYSSKAEQMAAGEALWEEMLAKAKASRAAREAEEAAALQTADTTGNLNLATKYPSEIAGRSVTHFRRLKNDLDVAEGDEEQSDVEATAQDDWVRYEPTVKIGKLESLTPVYALTADKIDDYMCGGGSDGKRRYLMLANANSPSSESELKKYIGVMSFKDDTVLGSLYSLSKINYLIGYMAIIVALGVYLNFTFGLIQRVINLAVLYVMSPITISFYPFDDGQRFKGQFVTPFYKEAISAYSVIISLNIFIVLLTPIKNAAVSVTGSDLMGTIALIAVISMLPKMRETITGLLGAGNLQQKSLTDIFKDAGNTLSDPFKQMNAIRKAPVNAAKKAGMAAWNSKAGHYLRDLSDRRAKSKSDFAKTLMGKENLNKKEQKFLDKYKKKHGIMDQNQDKLDKAIAAGKGSAEWKSLSKSERAMAKRQMKAAAKQAEKDLQNGTLGEAFLNDQIKNGATPEIRKKAEQQLAALKALQKEPGNEKKTIDQLAKEQRQKELLSDRSFVNSVDGVNTRKKLGKALEDKFKYTLVGDALATMFHPASGMLVKDKDSLLGNAIKWGSESERAKRLKHMYWEEKEWRDAKTDGKATKLKDAWQVGLSQVDAINAKDDTAKKAAAQMQARDQAQQAQAAANKKVDDEMAAIEKGGVRSPEFKQAYLAAAKKRMMQEEGFTEQQANTYAEMEYGQKTDKQLKAEWQKMASSVKEDKLKAATIDTNKMAKSLEDDLIRGVGGVKIDPKYLAAAKANSGKFMDLDNSQLQAYQKELYAEKQGTVNAMVSDMTKQLNLSADDAKGLDEVVLQSITAGDDMNTVTAKIMAHLPAGKVEEATVRRQMDTSGFANKVSQMQFDFKQESTMIKGAMTYNKKMASAQSALRENLNLDIADPRWQKMFDSVFRPMYDTEMKGGLIDQQNRLLEKYHGDATDPNYLREVETLSNTYTRQFDNAMDRLVSDESVFRRDSGNKVAQLEKSEKRAEIAVEMSQRFRYHVKNNMSSEATQLASMDTKLRNLEHDGNYIGSSALLRSSIESAIAKDWDALNASGLDQQTITQLRDWSEAGNMKDLNDLIKLTDIQRQMFGNARADGADNDIAGAMNELAAIMQMDKAKVMSDELKAMADAEGNNAAGYGKEVQKFVAMVDNKFKGDVWKEAVKIMNITTPEGRLIRDDKEFRAYLKDVTDRVTHYQLAEDAAEVQTLLDKMATMKGTWGEHAILTKTHGVQGNQAAQDLEFGMAGLNSAIMNVRSDKAKSKLSTASSEEMSGLHEQFIKANKQDKKA